MRSGLVARPIVAARTRHTLAASLVSEPIVRIGRILIPFYLRYALRFQGYEFHHPERIIEALQDFQDKRTRLIVAFRHAYGDEPQLLFHVIDNLAPHLARIHNCPLPHNPHLRMIHDYAVPLWGDALIRFVLPRSGAIPIYHVKFDPAGLKKIRAILADDPCPLGLAPEGQISYHSESVPRIEQGTVRVGFWCAQDLAKAGRSESVQILPLSIHYRYDWRDLNKVYRALDQLEQACRQEQSPLAKAARPVGSNQTTLLMDMRSRIEAIEVQLLNLTESFYATTYGYLPQSGQSRWMGLQIAALEIAEHLLGLIPNGADIVQRVYRIRQEGWDRIYPVTSVDHLSPLETALADRRAGEAWHAMRHMELVDLMSYHDTDYLQDATLNFDRVVESVINLQDLAARLMGGNITNRPNVIRKKAIMVPAPCLDLTARLPDYRKDNRQATREATEELDKRFKDCIEEHLHGTTH